VGSVGWEDDFLDLGRFLGGPSDPWRLERLDRHLWLELWRAPVVESVEELGIEARLYGPVLALAVADLKKTPLLNLVLGAGEPTAVSKGHLARALKWMESLGVDYRVAVQDNAPEGEAATELLDDRGHPRRGSLARFARRGGPPGFDPPPEIEVVEVTEFTEGFGSFTGEGFGLQLMGQNFFDNLPGRPTWRSYVAIDDDERPIASATMMGHFEVTQLGFAATKERDRGRGAHTALLHRRIADVAVAGHARTIFADTEEPLEDDDGPSPGARNLVRAGFGQVSVRSVWGGLKT
jgi:hypothetical protein